MRRAVDQSRHLLCRVSSELAITQVSGLQRTLDHLTLQGRELDSAYASLLRGSSEVDEIKLVHDHAISSGHATGTFLGNVLVQSYGKCGSLVQARAAFENIWDKNVYSWNMLIAAFADNGDPGAALELFASMVDEGATRPNRVTFLASLGAAAELGDLISTRSIHDVVKRRRFDDDRIVCNAMVNAYGKCGRPDEARKVFDSIRFKDVVSWTSMIGAYAQDETHASQAIELFHRMDVRPTEVTFVNALDACSSLGNLAEGRRIHAGIESSGFESQVLAGKRIGNALVNMYGKCGSLEEAEMIFNAMENKEVSAWNTMVAAYAHAGSGSSALRIIQLMDLNGLKPDRITFTSAISACSSSLEMMQVEGEKLHHRLASSGLLQSHIILENSLITMYGKFGCLDVAFRVFDSMVTKNTQSWNAIIAACVQNSEPDQALRLFKRMPTRQNEVTFVCVLGACSGADYLAEGAELHRMAIAGGFDRDPVLGSALVNMYSKCGSLEETRSVFDRLERKTNASWTSMINALVQHGRGNQGIRLFQEMELEGLKPTSGTLISVLGACTATGAFSQGRSLHARIRASSWESDAVRVALVNLYGKCARFKQARGLFDEIRCKRPLVWNSMISAYAQQGLGAEALELFYTMALEGVRANPVTFLCVFYACSHEGLAEKCLGFFRSMSSDFGLTPTAEHHGAIVDLLARQGHLKGAEELIDSMPFHADVVAWTSLLGACKTHSDSDRGERIGSRVMELENVSPGSPYSLLTNIYSGAGKVDEAHQTCKLMELRGARRQPGRSFIEVNGRVHEFVAGDESHPQTNRIREELRKLHEMMKAREGHLPDKGVVLHHVDEREKEDLLMLHSERLAVAFGIINSPERSTVRVVKNIRVCSDCHAAIKLISKLVDRKVVLRDASRFHHFQQGVCSCRDYW